MAATMAPRRRAEAWGSRAQRWAWLPVLVIAGVWGVHGVGLPEYRRDAQAFLEHPFARWPVEYPPATVVVMLPAALGLSVFAATMAAVAGALTVRLSRADAARRWIAYVLLGALAVVAGRFDVMVGACVLASLLAAERGRWGLAWTAAVGAAVLQWVGLVLAPLWLIAEWRETGRWRLDRAGLAAVAFVIPYAVAWIGGGAPAALSSVAYFLHRPVEYESLAAVIGVLSGPVHAVGAFGALNLVGPTLPAARLAVFAAQALGQGAIWIGVATRRLTIRDAAALAVTWLAACASVFSPQYLLWFLPLWALVMPRWRVGRLAVGVAILTTLDYPLAFDAAPLRILLLIVVARDLLLLALLAVAARNVLRATASSES